MRVRNKLLPEKKNRQLEKVADLFCLSDTGLHSVSLEFR